VLRWLLALGTALVLLLPTAALAGLTRSEAALLREINRVRGLHGLRPLRYDPHLERAARVHTRQMLAGDTFAHGAVQSRLVRFDVRGHLTGENLGWGAGPAARADAIVGTWLADPIHRANLLRGAFTRIGVGAVVGAFLGVPDARVVTADFAG